MRRRLRQGPHVSDSLSTSAYIRKGYGDCRLDFPNTVPRMRKRSEAYVSDATMKDLYEKHVEDHLFKAAVITRRIKKALALESSPEKTSAFVEPYYIQSFKSHTDNDHLPATFISPPVRSRKIKDPPESRLKSFLPHYRKECGFDRIGRSSCFAFGELPVCT